MPVQALRDLRVIAVLMASLALFVAFGWAVGSESMVRVWLSSAAMPLNTAILFMAGAICLWPTPSGTPSSTDRWSSVRIASAWLMVALASAMLAEHAFGIDFGIDWPSLHRHVNDGNTHPGRSAPNACLGFVLAGTAFIALARDQARGTRGRWAGGLVFATLGSGRAV